MHKFIHSDKYTCTYAQAEAHTYTHVYANMAHATCHYHVIVVYIYKAHDCRKICSCLLFYDNQHASSCMKAVSNACPSRVGLCKQVNRKILLENCAIRIRISIYAMLEFLTSCVTSISTFDYLVGVTSNDENYLPISTLLH